ncbi:MAG: response regulator [Nevskiales bacterium]|nr:response regulator [Nevskiales bacterium]
MAPRTALVVDDSRSARFAMRKYLEGLSYEVDTAENAQEAYQRLADRRPDLIFLDHVMPEEDGFAVLRRIKADAETAAIPVVICSSNEGEAFVAEARTQGAADVLQKPPTPLQIRQVIERLATPAPPAVDTADAQPAAAAEPAPAEPGTVAESPRPEALSAQLERAMGQLRAQIETVRKQATPVENEAPERLTALETRMSALEQRLNTELAGISKQQQIQIDDLHMQYQEQIDGLRAHHQHQIDALRDQLAAEVKRLHEKSDQDLRALHHQLSEKIEAVRQQARQDAIDQIGDALLKAFGRGG